ncbi:MAG: beta-ketoacyl synthase N-terminal-like domain-containing protein [Bilophila wadsworthia]
MFHPRLVEAGPGKVSLHDPHADLQHGPGQLAIATGAKGANMVLTSACASGTHAIGAAYTEIVMGRCDACISGGVEATVTPMGISGFTALKALSTAHNDDPEKASRPFDKDRDGFVMGEGAGLLMLESLEHAQRAARPSTPKS